MHFTKSARKSDLILGFVAASVVLMSGLAMSQLSAANYVMAQTAPNDQLAFGSLQDGVQDGALSFKAAPYHTQPYETVTQSAVAPDMRPDIPAIACPVSLELMDEGNAMIGGTLLAPCLPDQDLVIAHAGMVYTAKTLASGALFFSLPALQVDGAVDIRFSTGDTASAQISMPDAAQLQRVAVQWPFADGFAIHAFENGASFGGAGHIWQENPSAAGAGQGGYVTVLGNASAELPLMAQVYTYGPNQTTEVLFEAAVTETTCGGEIMGDIISAIAGTVLKSELTLAMPGCDALGEFVHVGYTLPTNGQELDLALAN